MTTLLQRLNDDRMTAFKTGDKEVKDALTTLYAECVAIGKNDGNRPTTDSEVVAVIKKTINNNNITIGMATSAGGQGASSQAAFAEKVKYCEWENRLFTKYLPMQFTKEELAYKMDDFLSSLHPDNPPITMKHIMEYFKGRYEGMYDGKLLSVIAKDRLANLK